MAHMLQKSIFLNMACLPECGGTAYIHSLRSSRRPPPWMRYSCPMTYVLSPAQCRAPVLQRPRLGRCGLQSLYLRILVGDSKEGIVLADNVIGHGIAFHHHVYRSYPPEHFFSLSSTLSVIPSLLAFAHDSPLPVDSFPTPGKCSCSTCPEDFLALWKS